MIEQLDQRNIALESDLEELRRRKIGILRGMSVVSGVAWPSPFLPQSVSVEPLSPHPWTLPRQSSTTAPHESKRDLFGLCVVMVSRGRLRRCGLVG
jgi:hypothetical protein